MGAGMQLLVVGACKYCLNLKKQRIMCNVSMITEPGENTKLYNYDLVMKHFTSV